MPPAKTDHGYMSFELGFALRSFAGHHQLGRVTGEGGYILSRDPDTVRAPDVGFISAGRLSGPLPPGEYFQGAPDLAVEVVSPDDRDSDVAEKIALWLSAGALRVWEVRPRTRTVTVHRPGTPPATLRAGDTLTSDDAAFSVDGFALLVGSIFE